MRIPTVSGTYVDIELDQVQDLPCIEFADDCGPVTFRMLEPMDAIRAGHELIRLGREASLREKEA